MQCSSSGFELACCSPGPWIWAASWLTSVMIACHQTGVIVAVAVDVAGILAAAGAVAVVTDLVVGVVRAAVDESGRRGYVGGAVGLEDDDLLRACAAAAAGVVGGNGGERRGVVVQQRGIAAELVIGQHQAHGIASAPHGPRHFHIGGIIRRDRGRGIAHRGGRVPERIREIRIVWPSPTRTRLKRSGPVSLLPVKGVLNMISEMKSLGWLFCMSFRAAWIPSLQAYIGDSWHVPGHQQ